MLAREGALRGLYGVPRQCWCSGLCSAPRAAARTWHAKRQQGTGPGDTTAGGAVGVPAVRTGSCSQHTQGQGALPVSHPHCCQRGAAPVSPSWGTRGPGQQRGPRVTSGPPRAGQVQEEPGCSLGTGRAGVKAAGEPAHPARHRCRCRSPSLGAESRPVNRAAPPLPGRGQHGAAPMRRAPALLPGNSPRGKAPPRSRAAA